MADDILRQGVQGITDLITTPGQINLDFADVRTVMADAGSAMMGVGAASGESRAVEAAKMAISFPAHGGVDRGRDRDAPQLHGLRGPQPVRGQRGGLRWWSTTADRNANIIFGTVIDPSIGDEIRVTVIATGFEGFETLARRPIQVREALPSAGVVVISPTPSAASCASRTTTSTSRPFLKDR